MRSGFHRVRCLRDLGLALRLALGLALALRLALALPLPLPFALPLPLRPSGFNCAVEGLDAVHSRIRTVGQDCTGCVGSGNWGDNPNSTRVSLVLRLGIGLCCALAIPLRIRSTRTATTAGTGTGSTVSVVLLFVLIDVIKSKELHFIMSLELPHVTRITHCP